MSWPSHASQIVNYFLFVAALIINAAIVGRRLHRYQAVFCGRWSLTSAWISEAALLATFANSAAFVLVVGALQYAVGLSSMSVCDGAIITCVTAYALTKIFIYLFFLERVYIVTGACNVRNRLDWGARWRCKPWLFGSIIYSFGVPCVILFVVSKRWTLGGTVPMCHVGLNLPLAVPFIVWDMINNIYLSINFVLPLVRIHQKKSTDIHVLTIRTLVASCISTVSSISNLVVLLVLKYELGWICLICCSTDVLVNALALSLLTQSSDNSNDSNARNTVGIKSNDPTGTCTRKEIRVTRHEMRETETIELPNMDDQKPRQLGSWRDVEPGESPLPLSIDLTESQIEGCTTVGRQLGHRGSKMMVTR